MGGAAEESPDQQAPVLETFATKNAEPGVVDFDACRVQLA
jgi:hypothetical protein